jgi:hypothetical protein
MLYISFIQLLLLWLLVLQQLRCVVCRIPNIVRQLQGRGITTVGQLAALSEFDIHTLDFKPPKLDTVCNAFKGLLLRTPGNRTLRR